MSLSTTSDSPLISVVAPVYKVEPFLQECIDSVLNQSFKDFELILVDDGSPDKCGEICDKAAEKDSRIRVFHQENGGVSSARKLGVDNAKGEWICFVDPDDRLLPDALQDLITACDTLGYNIDDFDIIEGGNKTFKTNKRTGKEKAICTMNEVELKKCGNFTVDALTYIKNISNLEQPFCPSLWKKIIRKRLLIETDALNIPRYFLSGEDVLAVLKYTKKLRKTLRIQKDVYEYRTGIDSATAKNKYVFSTFSYNSAWWEAAREILKDMSEEWMEAYKNLIATRFYGRFLISKTKTWNLRSTEFAPYLSILREKKDLLPTAAKICLLSTRFPFTLIPERLFYMTFFSTKFIVMLPIRVIRKLWRIIRRR